MSKLHSRSWRRIFKTIPTVISLLQLVQSSLSSLDEINRITALENGSLEKNNDSTWSQLNFARHVQSHLSWRSRVISLWLLRASWMAKQATRSTIKLGQLGFKFTSLRVQVTQRLNSTGQSVGYMLSFDRSNQRSKSSFSSKCVVYGFMWSIAFCLCPPASDEILKRLTPLPIFM